MFSKIKINNKPIKQEKEIETVVGESIKVKGNFTGKGSIIINGYVEGNVQSNDTVFVGKKAKIVGNVDSEKAIVNGEIIGNLKIKDCLELKSTAKVTGDIKCSILLVERGLIFNGKCTMNNDVTQTVKHGDA